MNQVTEILRYYHYVRSTKKHITNANIRQFNKTGNWHFWIFSRC